MIFVSDSIKSLSVTELNAGDMFAVIPKCFLVPNAEPPSFEPQTQINPV